MDRVISQFEEVAPATTLTPGASAWTAREAGNGRRVLIKRMAEDFGKTRATQSLALSHPHIVPTRRWLRDAGFFYLVRDFVPGRNLRLVLADASQRAFDRLRALLDPILEALEYAHQLGLPHGHVTPENVLVTENGVSCLSDFTTADSQPTPRADYQALCELYKEFLPERPRDDEAATAARARLLRNLTEMQQTANSVDELRYKLDAVSKMAELLGFTSNAAAASSVVARRGAQLVCAVTPPTATLNPGGGTSVILSVRNEGDLPLRVETVGSDTVWLNPYERFSPLTIAADTGREIVFTISGARLQPGRHQANLLIRSNSTMLTQAPPSGTPWHETSVALPVFVKGPAASPSNGNPIPLAEALPLDSPPPAAIPAVKSGEGETHPGIAVTQEPDPGLVRYGQIGVIHIGVKNIGQQKLRIDKISTWPPWLAYPGDFQAVWIEPGATQFLGFSVMATALTGGDYKAEITFVTSVLTETMLGTQPVWREMRCDVRVRVVRGAGDVRPDLAKTGMGCASILLALIASSAGLLGLLIACLR